MRWLTTIFTRPRPNANHKTTATLQLEEFETRLVPSNTTSSNNWAGYAVNSTAGSVSAVSGSWTVPAVTGAGTEYAATWVGIDGFSSNSVEQLGTSENVVNGVAQYSAWYEMYPAGEVPINGLAIHPGDSITASVTYANGKFTLTIKDANDPAGSNTFSITEAGANLSRSSAEWIQEAPSSGSGILPLANFGTVSFTNAQATINGVSGSIGSSSWAGNLYAINMDSQFGETQASTSALNSAGTGFTVTYGDTAVSPPTTSPPTTTSPPPTTTSPPPTTTPPPVATSPPPVTTPSPPTTVSPPTPVSTAPTVTLVGVADSGSWLPTVTLTAELSQAVPVGSGIVLFSNGMPIAIGIVEDVGGVYEASFTVQFSMTGLYEFTAEYLGSGTIPPSVSNTMTVTVSEAARSRAYASVLLPQQKGNSI